MEEHMPDEVRAELQKTLEKIAAVLADTNTGLFEKGLGNFAIVAGSIFYNDPEAHCTVTARSIVVLPVQEETGDEVDLEELPQESKLAVYSSRNNKVVAKRRLRTTQLSSGACNEANEGQSCAPGKRCKKVPLPGKLPCYLCLPAT